MQDFKDKWKFTDQNFQEEIVIFYLLRPFIMLWIWNFDQCGPFTNEDHYMTSIFNFLDQWNISFWPVKSSKVTWHSNWRHELSSFIKVHLRWKVQVAHVKSVRIWNFSSQYFPASVWILRFTEQISIFSRNAGKYEPEKLRIRALLYSA